LPEEIELGLNTQNHGKECHAIMIPYRRTQKTIACGKWREPEPLKGRLLLLETQEKGRGRKGRSWVSLPEGGIYLSLILRPNLAAVPRLYKFLF